MYVQTSKYSPQPQPTVPRHLAAQQNVLYCSHLQPSTQMAIRPYNEIPYQTLLQPAEPELTTVTHPTKWSRTMGVDTPEQEKIP